MRIYMINDETRKKIGLSTNQELFDLMFAQEENLTPIEKRFNKVQGWNNEQINVKFTAIFTQKLIGNYLKLSCYNIKCICGKEYTFNGLTAFCTHVRKRCKNQKVDQFLFKWYISETLKQLESKEENNRYDYYRS